MHAARIGRRFMIHDLPFSPPASLEREIRGSRLPLPAFIEYRGIVPPRPCCWLSPLAEESVMNRKLMLFALVGALAVGALWGWCLPASGQKEAVEVQAVAGQPGPRLGAKAQAATLPIRQVILFSSGVG